MTSKTMTGFSWFELVILSLATWRASTLLASDSGPMMIFERLRFVLGVTRGVNNEQLANDGTLARLISCVDCLSLWIAAGLMFLMVVAPTVAMLLAVPLAVSTVTIFINQRDDR